MYMSHWGISTSNAVVITCATIPARLINLRVEHNELILPRKLDVWLMESQLNDIENVNVRNCI